MKRKVLLIIFVLLFFTSIEQVWAQSFGVTRLSTTETTTVTYETPRTWPQWARDLRRFDIIAFGLFPFSMFVVTFATDMIRWYEANGLDTSDMRYAPWPLKSAGAVEMTNDEYARTILISAGLSLAVAFIDLMIVRHRRNSERQRLENLPASTYDIERTPHGEQPSAPEEE